MSKDKFDECTSAWVDQSRESAEASAPPSEVWALKERYLVQDDEPVDELHQLSYDPHSEDKTSRGNWFRRHKASKEEITHRRYLATSDGLLVFERKLPIDFWQWYSCVTDMVTVLGR